MSRGRKVAQISGLGILVVGLIFSILFLVASHSTKSEWASRQKEHSAVEQRSILNAIKNFASEPPNFLPLSGLDNEMCAASVINAVNYVFGVDILRSVPAWKFWQENQNQLEVVYDRSKDFMTAGRHIVVRTPRTIDIHDYFKDDAVYILGYHYKETHSDGKIIDAGRGLNSHLMLLLGDLDGELVGYHLIHYPDDDGKNPVKVETLSAVLPLLDLVYIWKVKGPPLTQDAPTVALINTTPPYTMVRGWIGHGFFPFEYYLDTVSVWIHSRLKGSGQFPVLLNLDRDLVEAPNGGPRFHGRVRGFYNEVPIYWQVGPSTRGEFGLQFQCVEFVNRYYVSLGFNNMSHHGDADSYFYEAKSKGLEPFPNGGTTKPEIDDILVFDRENNDGSPGHVAIIYSVTDKLVCFVQQNTRLWRDCLPLEKFAGHFTLQLPAAQSADYPAPPKGWSRWSQ